MNSVEYIFYKHNPFGYLLVETLGRLSTALPSEKVNLIFGVKNKNYIFIHIIRNTNTINRKEKK
jgi:hypothetical protein